MTPLFFFFLRETCQKCLPYPRISVLFRCFVWVSAGFIVDLHCTLLTAILSVRHDGFLRLRTQTKAFENSSCSVLGSCLSREIGGKPNAGNLLCFLCHIANLTIVECKRFVWFGGLQSHGVGLWNRLCDFFFFFFSSSLTHQIQPSAPSFRAAHPQSLTVAVGCLVTPGMTYVDDP